jgi:hypothetical protein
VSLGSASTRPVHGSREDALLASARSGGFAVRYNEDDAVHRILEPTSRGNSTVGLVMIREGRIMYAEFDRTIYPWWGRSDLSPEYAAAFERLDTAIREGRRK